MLVAVFPANINVAVNHLQIDLVSTDPVMQWVRLLVQPVLIWLVVWASGRERLRRTEVANPSMLHLAAMEAPTGYELDDNPARVDLDVVWGFLSTEAYWGRWRTRDIVEQQVRSAWRVIGAYERRSGKMVGFARALSDGCALAYLADVFVLPAHRGQGLGVRLVRAMIEDGPGATFLWMLHTADAHGLYAKFGFAPRRDERYLERPAQRG
jgi:GNAT superfamily N-acetyltransferase